MRRLILAVLLTANLVGADAYLYFDCIPTVGTIIAVCTSHEAEDG